MKKNVMKKSLLCVLSISFALVLASCKKASNEKSISSTNVFAKKDILAYARKNKIEKFNENIAYTAFDNKAYSIEEDEITYSLVSDKTTSKWYLYSPTSNVTVDLKTDDTDMVIDVYTTGTFHNNFGYYRVEYLSGDSMLINYNGEVIIDKGEISDIDVTRINNYAINVGEFTFYDVITYEDTDEKTLVYKIDAKYNKGSIEKGYKMSKLDSIDEIDYSIFDKNNGYIPLEKYDVTYSDGNLVVKDLKGNLKSSLIVDLNEFIALDDKIIYQTTQSATINDPYTYCDNNSYYTLRTYQIDLESGKTCELKDYEYIIDDVEYIIGYNESKDREYYAAINASLIRINNKRLSNLNTIAMIDKNGKILSTKPGEVGYELSYLNDNTYILHDYDGFALLDKNGKAKANFYDRNFIFDYDNGLIFMPESYSGTSYYIVDTDLKLIETNTIRGTYNVIRVFNDGNAVIKLDSGKIQLVKFNGKEVTVIEEFDYSNNSQALTIPSSDNEGCKYIMTNSTLDIMNMYLVEVLTATGRNIEVHLSNGELIATYNDVTSLTFNYGRAFKLQIVTSDARYYYGATTLPVENN